jgi:hypothetical protein
MPYKVEGANGTIAEHYDGFSPYRAGDRRIIIATFDGETDLYGVDDGINPSVAIESLKSYYQRGYNRLPELIVAYDYEGYPALPSQ